MANMLVEATFAIILVCCAIGGRETGQGKHDGSYTTQIAPNLSWSIPLSTPWKSVMPK